MFGICYYGDLSAENCRYAVRTLRQHISGLFQTHSVRFHLKWVLCLDTLAMQFVSCCWWR